MDIIKKIRLSFLLFLVVSMHFLLHAIGVSNAHQYDFFSLHTTSTWHEYTFHSPFILDNQKLAWACSFILKSKKPVKLTTIILQWQGRPLTHLSASLYQKKERDSTVMPIQKNLVCDGSWDQKTQQLTFSLNEKIVAVNKYHLLLSFSKALEPKIRSGKFMITDIRTSLII